MLVGLYPPVRLAALHPDLLQEPWSTSFATTAFAAPPLSFSGKTARPFVFRAAIADSGEGLQTQTGVKPQFLPSASLNWIGSREGWTGMGRVRVEILGRAPNLGEGRAPRMGLRMGCESARGTCGA